MKKLLFNSTVLFLSFLFVLQFSITEKVLGAQDQTQTNNPGVGTMTQEEQQTQTENTLQLQQRIQESKPTYITDNLESQNRTNQASNAAENMIRLAERIENQGETDQIRNIAQAQIQSEDKVNQAIDQVQKRSSVTKFFIGADYKDLKEVKAEIEQNRLRIQELNRIMAQIQNEGDKTELQNQIATLEAQNIALQNQLDDLTSGFSLFGWFFRWIYEY